MFYKGVDAYWVSTINDYANLTTPSLSYVLVPHPGTSPNSGGNAVLARILLVPNGTKGGRRIAIFRDGCVHDVDLAGQKYTKIFNLYDKVINRLSPAFHEDILVFLFYFSSLTKRMFST